MPVKLPWSVWRHLRRDGNVAVRDAWMAAGLQNKLDEVSCIRNLIDQGLPRLEADWRGILAGHNITISIRGVVCHGRPFVTYSGSQKSCELGDMLILHDHVFVDGGAERRASLVQAKIFGKNGVTSPNQTQTFLYQHWPRFTYTGWPGGIARLEEA